MEIRFSVANVLVMNITFTESHFEETRTVTRLEEPYRVTKTQRSGSGFQTPTGTTWTCRGCRNETTEDRGAQPFTMATWRLTGESWGGERVSYLHLCREHFKQVREGPTSSVSPYDRGTPFARFVEDIEGGERLIQVDEVRRA